MRIKTPPERLPEKRLNDMGVGRNIRRAGAGRGSRRNLTEVFCLRSHIKSHDAHLQSVWTDRQTRSYKLASDKRKEQEDKEMRLIDADLLKKSITCSDSEEKKRISPKELHDALDGWIDAQPTADPNKSKRPTYKDRLIKAEDALRILEQRVQALEQLSLIPVSAYEPVMATDPDVLNFHIKKEEIE